MRYLSIQNIQNLGQRFAKIRKEMDLDLENVKSHYSHILYQKDIRITSVSRLQGIFGMAHLNLMFLYKDLMNRNWWNLNIKQSATDSDIQALAYSYSSYSRMAFIQSTFSTVENSIRLLIRAINPGAFNSGTVGFKNIYDHFLRSILNHYPDSSIELLDLLRLVRNSVHNNGVFFHSSGNDREVIWKGDTYSFKHEQPVDFVNWDFCITIADYVRQLLLDIMMDDNIHAYRQLIADPFDNK